MCQPSVAPAAYKALLCISLLARNVHVLKHARQQAEITCFWQMRRQKSANVYIACLGNADKAWVPAGTHYLDKQAHEALTPKHPPNNPQGNTCPSPPSSCRHQSRNSTSRQSRAAAKSPVRPPWDTWGSPGKASRGEQSSPCQSPTRAELKRMTASWSPGRKGFVKPELVQAQENRFSHTQGSLAEARRQASKLRKKQSSHKKAPAHKEALYRSGEAGRPAKTGSGASIWAGTPAGPPQPSFLRPILHSQQSNDMPDGTDTQHDRQMQFDSQVQNSPAKRKKKRQGDSRRARAQRQQSRTGEEKSQAELDGRSQSQNSPPKIYTLDQSPRGSYVSPFRSSPRRGLSGRHDASLFVLQSPQHAPRSMRSLNFPELATQCSKQLAKGSRSSHLSTQRSQFDSLEGDSSQLNAQPSESGSESSCSFTEASQCSRPSEGGQEEERSWAASSMKAESGTIPFRVSSLAVQHSLSSSNCHGQIVMVKLSVTFAVRMHRHQHLRLHQCFPCIHMFACWCVTTDMTSSMVRYHGQSQQVLLDCFCQSVSGLSAHR